MTEKPILFSGPMVRAILEGRKTQTRRVYKVAPGGLRRYPYGKEGDHLWVRETLRISERSYRGIDGNHLLSYRATHVPVQIADTDEKRRWVNERITSHVERAHDALGLADFRVPSIFMPRWACRLVLEVKSVRVERLQEISENDAIAEGVDAISLADEPRQATWSRRQDFAQLWDSLNEKRGYGWDTNPWVWGVEFTRVQTGQNDE